MQVDLHLKPRFVHPLNFRLEDKPILDQAIEIAKREGTNLTEVVRIALAEYTSRIGTKSTAKMDEFLKDSSYRAFPEFSRILKPEELGTWTDAEVLMLAKMTRSRKQELHMELRRRGFYFEW